MYIYDLLVHTFFKYANLCRFEFRWFFWTVGFEAAFFFLSNLSLENFSSQIIPTPTH